LYVFPTRNVVSFLINFTFLTATYLSEARYRLFVVKVPLNTNQSVNQSISQSILCYTLICECDYAYDIQL